MHRPLYLLAVTAALAIGAAAPAQAFTPPIGTDKGSATAAPPAPAPTAPHGIIAILIG
jgi:hypothetical protein